MALSDDLLQKLLTDIHTHVESLDTMIKGDGTEGNLGMLIKLDRLIQAAATEKTKRQRATAQMWSAVSALAVMLLGSWLARYLHLAP